jgi:hypothetical protein
MRINSHLTFECPALFWPAIQPRFNLAPLVITITDRYAFLSPSDGQSRILIHGNYGNHKGSSILAGLFGMAEEDVAFKRKVLIFLQLNFHPLDAHVPSSLSFISSRPLWLLAVPRGWSRCQLYRLGTLCLSSKHSQADLVHSGLDWVSALLFLHLFQMYKTKNVTPMPSSD